MPPVCLSASASTEPRTITTAMLCTVLPKPGLERVDEGLAVDSRDQREEQDGHQQRKEHVPAPSCDGEEEQRDDADQAGERNERAVGDLRGHDQRAPPIERRSITTGCSAVRPVPCEICCRQETPVAAMRAFTSAALTAGKRRSAPICIERS